MELTYYLNDVSDPLTQVLMTYGEEGYNAAYTYGLERIEVEAVDETRPESQDPLYYLYDGLGSVTFMVKPDGNVRDHYRYDEFGKPAPGNSKQSEDGRINLHNTFGYTGEQWDEEANLLYLRARYYEPETGRFLSRDTYEGELENPLSKHLYAYVGNNPVNFTDHSGHSAYSDYEALPQVKKDAVIGWIKLAGYYDAKTAGNMANMAKDLSEKYQIKYGFKTALDNKVDAYRHFMWNVLMIRNGVGYNDAAQMATFYEKINWKYSSDTTNYGNSWKKVIRIMVSTLMDLWNNKAGRDMASNKNYKTKTPDELFNIAFARGSLITSLDQVPRKYKFDKRYIIPSQTIDGPTVLIQGDINENPRKIKILDYYKNTKFIDKNFAVFPKKL